MRRSHLFAKRSNSRSSEFTHARENLSRKFSISIHVSRFSKISHSISICRRCQKHFVICLFSSWLASIVSRTESNKLFMKISFLKQCWSEEVTKVICFSNFSLVILLVWESHYFERILDRVNLSCLVSSLILSLIYLWRSLTCCLLLFYWFVKTWLFFFFVVISFWSSTITHLLFTLCDSLSNDKYEKKKNRKNDQTWQEKKTCVTVSFRESVLYSYSSNESVSMMYL